MAKRHLNIDKKIEVGGNKIYYRNLRSYHTDFHSHDAVQILIPLDNANFEITWELEDKDTESKPLGAGDICIIPPLLGHEVRWINCAHFVNFYIFTEYIYVATNHAYDKESAFFSAQIGLRDQFIFHLGQAVRQMALLQEADNYKYYDATMTVLANYLVNNHILQNEQEILFKNFKQLPCEKIRAAVMFMSNNVDRNLSVQKIAAEVEMSQYHFVRVFREQVGMPPIKFHTLQRIEKAKELLRGRKKIIDVAYDLGFSSQSHFSNVFTKSVGMTPFKFQQDH